jgi:hypothetical protein
MWQKYIIETSIKRSMILFNLFQMLLGEWYVVVLSMDDTELLVTVDVRSQFWRRIHEPLITCVTRITDKT